MIKILKIFKMIYSLFYSLFYPNSCLVCGKYLPPNVYVCKDCIPEKIFNRNFNIEINTTAYFLPVYFGEYYNDNYQHCVRRFKFNRKTSYAKKFARYIVSMSDGKFDLYDMICFVPMSVKKQRERGYNQAELFAKELSKCLDIPVSKALIKIKENKTQHELSPKERRENMKNVFACNQDLHGKNILMVDDVITTGSTLVSSTKELYKAGANGVTGITITSTGNQK